MFFLDQSYEIFAIVKGIFFSNRILIFGRLAKMTYICFRKRIHIRSAKQSGSHEEPECPPLQNIFVEPGKIQ